MSICITVAILLLLSLLLIYKSKRKTVPKNDDDLQKYTDILEQEVSFYQELKEEDKPRFVNELSAFLQRTNIEGVGTSIDDLDRVLVAASAIIPIFSFQGWRYPNLTNVILYPDTFNEEFHYEGKKRNTLGMVGTGYMNGQMILSKPALRHGFLYGGDKSNTGIHEFVHLIDKSDGSTDGIPEGLLGKSYIRPWVQLMHEEMKKIAKGTSNIDGYALTNEAEFFAVVSEYFFEKPEELQKHHPKLYDMLNKMFNPKEIT